MLIIPLNISTMLSQSTNSEAMNIIGIETSCDETGVAIYNDTKGIISNELYSQIDIHRQFGGVVPELASRDHIRRTLPMIDQALQIANLASDEINGIAYTAGPGLIGALLVGASIAKSLAYAWDIPSLGIHHMEGHLLAARLSKDAPDYPFIALLVSGGHTQIMICRKAQQYDLLGDSQDDAAGEAFDKVAKMLGLSYPGGPSIAELATDGDPKRFKFPRPMTNKPGLDFSFSGLKTYTLNTIASIESLNRQDKADIATAFQEAVVDTIRIKCERALDQTGLDTLVIAGGVSANLELRSRLDKLCRARNCRLFSPPLNLCTDNGAMIAYAGYLRLAAGISEDLAINARPRWPMMELN